MHKVGLPMEGLTGPYHAAGYGAPGGVATGTVHRFQGGERRVVLFSTVVTEERSLRFLNGRVNLVNVAVSRAREHLVVVGSPEILRRGPYSRLLVERATPLEG
jgi:superfamily I DNA and/or RNA helicase